MHNLPPAIKRAIKSYGYAQFKYGQSLEPEDGDDVYDAETILLNTIQTYISKQDEQLLIHINCPIGLDKTPEICSAGICSRCIMDRK